MPVIDNTMNRRRVQWVVTKKESTNQCVDRLMKETYLRCCNKWRRILSVRQLSIFFSNRASSISVSTSWDVTPIVTPSVSKVEGFDKNFKPCYSRIRGWRQKEEQLHTSISFFENGGCGRTVCGKWASRMEGTTSRLVMGCFALGS